MSSVFVAREFGRDLHEQTLGHASLGLNFGGLGFSKATMLAAPAHLAFLIDAKPCVIHLLGLARKGGVDLPAAVSTYNIGIVRAKADCPTRVSPASASF